jgi:hypothetical protein
MSPIQIRCENDNIQFAILNFQFISALADLLFFMLKISDIYNKDGATCRVVAEGEA